MESGYEEARKLLFLNNKDSSKVDEVILKANKVLSRIPTADGESIKIPNKECWCYYERMYDGYYQIVEDRGLRKMKVADNEKAFLEYLIHNAISDYARRYELNHRRLFESNLRQVHEIMEDCYKHIKLDRKFIQKSYNDQIHIYFDLMDYYTNTANEILESGRLKEEILYHVSYVAKKQYRGLRGGMVDVPFTFTLVKYHVGKICELDPKVIKLFSLYEDQCERLVLLEKINPDQPTSYILGTWDDLVIERADSIIRRLHSGDYNTLNTITDDEVKTCICKMLICNVYTERNLERDLKELIKTISIISPMGYEKSLRELLIEDKYGIFPNYVQGRNNLRVDAKEKLKLMGIIL